MKHVAHCLAALALAACAVEGADISDNSNLFEGADVSEAPALNETSQSVVDPNICAPGPWFECNGASQGEVCGHNPFRRCFAWLEVGDGSSICSCTTEPIGLVSEAE